MSTQKSVLSVRFRSTFKSSELNQLFHDNLDHFKNVPGLLEKYYLKDEQSDVVGGIYIFDSKSSKINFWNSDLAKSIPGTYGVIMESLKVEQLDVTIDMMDAVPV